MQESVTSGDLRRAAIPLGIGLVGLAVASWSRFGDPLLAPPGLWVLPVLGAVALLAALHAPFGRGSLGLGTVALPLAALAFGPVAAAGLGAAVAVVSEPLRRELASPPAAGEGGAGGTLRVTGRVLLACLAAVVAWELLRASPEIAGAESEIVTAGAVAALVYLLALPALGTAAAHAGGEDPDWPSLLAPLVLDLGGWVLGLAVAWVAATTGWGAALVIAAGVALLAGEALRNRRATAGAYRRLADLQKVTRASHRMVFRTLDLTGIAEELHRECRAVLPFDWFQLELLAGVEGPRSWQAGPDGLVTEGVPVPPRSPVVKGRKRWDWRRVERSLATEEEELARLRLWCDPRNVDAEALELLDALLPQMASSVARALLDREAKRDPLTDLPDRRALEKYLARAFARAREEGVSMAVVMCDLDGFKRINDIGGHTTGDRALVEVAHALDTHRREQDLCGRYGGDEFMLVLEDTAGATALAIAERLRSAVGARRVPDLERLPLRLCAGVAAFPELPVRSVEELVQLADEALYESKRRGRDRCLLHRGRGRFQSSAGEIHEDPETPDLEPPTLFA